MFEFKLYFGRADEEIAASAGENNEDELGIIGNQDETSDGALPNSDDEAMGGMGTGEYGLSGAKFARGEIDVVEQMARTTRGADHAAHRDEDVFPGYDTATEAGLSDAVQDGMSHRKPSEDGVERHPARGEGTGAFTDVGAGRSGVTRHH